MVSSSNATIDMEQPNLGVTFKCDDNHGIQLGANYGTVNNSINTYYSGAPEPSPKKPKELIPFCRDRDFIKRPEFDEIWQRVLLPAARVGVVGLGGVGKTQLAIECAYDRQKEDECLWVFWVHASSTLRFEQSFRDIALHIGLSSWRDPIADVLSQVYSWMTDKTNGRWMMVVDNADSSEVLFTLRSCVTKTSTTTGILAGEAVLAKDNPLSEYLPSVSHGSILITSRNRDVLQGLIGYPDDIIEVGPMILKNATALLTTKLRRESASQEDLERLVQELDFMPLAITQAASYLQRRSRTTVTQYLDKLVIGDDDRDQLLEKEMRDARRDVRASNSIIKTWHISFDDIQKTQASAARLLALMSLFDRESIPESLLQGQYSLQRESQTETDSVFDASQTESSFEEDLAILEDYSMVRIGNNKHLFNMHRLVQYSTRKWLKGHRELEYWQKQYVHILRNAFPACEYSNYSTCQLLLPHVETLTSYSIESEGFLRDKATAMYLAGCYTWEMGKILLTEKLAKLSLDCCEKAFGPDSVHAFDCTNLVAAVLQIQGKSDEAEPLTRRALKGREEKLGTNHLKTLTSKCNLTSLLLAQDNLSGAEQVGRQTLDECEKVFGKSYIGTLQAIINLAFVLLDRGKYNEAEKYSRRGLVIGEEHWTNHAFTLQSMTVLAIVFRNQGKYSESEQLHRRALAKQEKLLGMDHPTTLWNVSSLSLTLREQGRFNEAAQLSQRVTAQDKKESREKYPPAWENLAISAIFLREQGKFAEAEQIHRQILEERERTLGVSNITTIQSVNSLALALQAQGKYDEAETFSRRALKGRKEKLGPTHPSTLESVSNLVLILKAQGKFAEMEHLERQALLDKEETLGPDHPKTWKSMSNLASALRTQNRSKEAEKVYRDVLRKREAHLGPSHPETLISMTNLASVLRDQGEFDEAEQLHRQALSEKEKSLGKDHPSTLTSIGNLAALLQSQGRYDEAEQFGRRALTGRETKLGKSHLHTLKSLCRLAEIQAIRNKHEEALELYDQAMKSYTTEFGLSHPDSMACQKAMQALRHNKPT